MNIFRILGMSPKRHPFANCCAELTLGVLFSRSLSSRFHPYPPAKDEVLARASEPILKLVDAC